METSSRGDQLKRALIGEYELTAAYYRTTALLLQDRINKYKYLPEELETVHREIKDAQSSAEEFQGRADKLKGDSDGAETRITFPAAMSSQLPGQAEPRITCTTVL